MSERDRSLLMPQSQLNVSGVLSQLNSKQMVQSHISEIMSNFKGGKNQMEYVVIFVTKTLHDSKNLQKIFRSQLADAFGEFLNYKIVDKKQEILEESLKNNVLYYIVADDKTNSWAQKFSRQEREESQGKKYIGVIKLLQQKKFNQSKTQRDKLREKKKVEAERQEYYTYDINMQVNEQEFVNQVQLGLVPFIEEKLTVALDKEKNKAKNWAISNKYKNKKKAKQRLYLYVEKDPQGNVIESIQKISKLSAKKGNYKWVQVIPFQNYRDIIEHIQKREEEVQMESEIASQASQIFTSRIFDKSQSRIGGMSRINPMSSRMLNSSIRSKSPSPSTINSNKHIPIDKMQHGIPENNRNFIICSKDFDEMKKIYHFVMSQKKGNWKLIEYEDQNVADIKKEIQKLIVDNRKKEEEMMESDIISAKTLYLFVPVDDAYAQNIYRDAKNYFRNSQMMLYESPEQLRDKLNHYSRNIDNYTVVFLKYANSEQHSEVMDFIDKNCQWADEKNKELNNLTYMFTSGNNYNSVTSYLSMNSIYNSNNESAYQWLHAILEDRDRYFHPLEGLQGRNVYILVRYDHQNQLIDKNMQDHIARSPRLQKTTYRDENYLKHIITNIRRKKDSVLVLTNDPTLREAQAVVKNFDEVAIMNITDRNMKEQVKVLAWGPKETIYQFIYSIKESKQKLKKMPYDEIGPLWSRERQNRILPEKIDFSGGKLVTVRIPDTEADPNSAAMENNLDFYFNEEIRFEYYKDPKEVRLINKKEEPLSFVICKDNKDNKEQLQYMKKISREEKDHLRQEYILYSQRPYDYQYLVTDEKHPRFRFISNSWEKIEDYIIGVYQLINGFDNDSIYNDELIHVFYYPEDQKTIEYLLESAQTKPIKRLVRVHRLQKNDEERCMEEILALQSPHHLYFLLLNEREGIRTYEEARKLIQKANSTYTNFPTNFKYKVPPKEVKIIMVRNNKLAGKGVGVKAAFESSHEAADYIADTQIKPYRLTQHKPYILINNSTQDWYYFLLKYQQLYNRFRFGHFENQRQLQQTVRKIRDADVGCRIWILLNRQEELKEYQRVVKKLENGRDIDFIFHGDGWLSRDKMIMVDGSREQIQHFLLNHYKRSNRCFSPEMLQAFEPRIYMSQQTSSKVMISQAEKQKWIEDLNAEFITFTNPPEQLKLNVRPVFMIEDINEDNRLKGYNHVRRIIFDSNEKNREKNHEITQIYQNKRDLYVGYYPAQISDYLRFLRFNIKNPPVKISRFFPSSLTRIYKQESLDFNPQSQNILQLKNDSIVDIIPFSDLEQAIRDSQKYPAYNSLFLLGRTFAQKLRHMKNSYNYICFDQKNRISPIHSQAVLETEDPSEYITYLFNLPEKRYEKAKKLKKQLQVYYLDNSEVTPYARELDLISKRNNAFKVSQYSKINDLKNINEDITVLVTNQMLKNHKRELVSVSNITYFIIDEDRLRNLEPDSKKYEFFITKSTEEPNYFFNNARIISGSQKIAQQRPIINIPNIMSKKFALSKPLKLKYLDESKKFTIYPPFELKSDHKDENKIIPNPPTEKPYNPVNFIDVSSTKMFKLPPSFKENLQASKIDINSFHIDPVKTPEPVPITLDYPPAIIQHNFDSKQDTDNILPIMEKPQPRKLDKTLAILYPETPQFLEIIRVLRENLHPKSFIVSEFPYKSQYDLENYFRNYLQKFESGYDKTLFFFTLKYYKYLENLKAVKNRMGHRLQYYLFEDNFHLTYDIFRTFLQPYNMGEYSLPYIKKDEPEFWLSTNIYNVLVPLNMKKKYDILKSENVRVLIYKPNDLNEIDNQLHCQSEFVIIVCDKKNFHNLKHFPRMSPRCFLVIEDSETLYVDEVVLFRYPLKVLYYGPDALNYLHKYKIPTRKLPFKQQTLKTIFFNPNIGGQFQEATSENYDSYEKISYLNNEDLFVKLIERFRNCSNFKLPSSRAIKTPIKLIPKLYMNKNAAYQLSYKNQYSAIQSRSQFKPTFKTEIRPSQYAHLPVKDYESYKDLAIDLEKEQCPCIVYVDLNVRQYQKIVKEMQHKHLFVLMFDYRDRWIQKNGDLTATHLLARPQELTIKQVLFTSMFNEEVFDTYNDMGYFYLSNKADIDKKRNITFMTKQKLVETYQTHPNLLMIIFVESTDKQHIPSQFYNVQMDSSQDDRVKLIFLHHSFVNNDHTLYIKFNEIDPVINHINRVEISGRVDYCLYPTGELGNLVWHKFSQQNRGYESIPYNTIEEIDRIAQDIKGKFRHVMVICDKDDYGSIQTMLNEYSIKTKPLSNEKVTFQIIPEIQKQSYAKASAIKKSSILHFNDNEEDNLQKFETVGHGIDIKLNSGYNTRIEDVIESKNFVLSVNEKLRDVFPIGNFYASKVKYFRDLRKLGQAETGKTQLVISHQNYPQIQKMMTKNPEIFVVYVSNDIPGGQNGNTLVIKEEQIPNLISKLQGTAQQNDENQMLNHESQLNIKNLQEYKIVRIVYDNNIDKETKKKILNASIKNKNIVPMLYKDMDSLKEIVKEEQSLVLLMMSSEPAELSSELLKEDYVIINKRKAKMILPKKFDSAIDGLSTILQEHESELEHMQGNNLTQSNINLYLNMIQKNPEKNKKVLMVPAYHSHDQEQEKESNKGLDNDHENITKLRVHSVIRQQNLLDEDQIYKIKQRLDGGVIVVVVDKKHTQTTKQILSKYNVLTQEYSHAVNLSQSIRDRKDKVTIVVIQKNMLDSIMPIKKQFPRLVFILLNQNHESISKDYQPFISGEINKINEIQAIINDIYEENQKIKYSDQMKSPSRFDNRKTSTVDVANSQRFSVGFNNTRAKKAFVFYKEPQNSMIINRLSEYLNNIQFIPYKQPADLQKKVNTYQGYQAILIANNTDIPELEEYVSKKKDQIYVIRYNPAKELKENPKIKLLLSTSSEQDISTYLLSEFHRNSLASERTITSRMNLNRNIPETKKYVQKYEPNTFGTTPRFAQDFVPPKSKESTYSKRYLKSGSKSSKILGHNMRSIDPRSIQNSSYYH